MDLRDKITQIFNYLENRSIANPEEAAQMQKQAIMKEREIFERALIDTIKSGGMSYDEAVARVKASDFSPLDQNIILANIGHLEANLPIKTASQKSMEVDTMDPVSKEIEELKKRLPHYGAFVENVLKTSYYLGTGDKAKPDPQGERVFKEDEKYVEQSKSEEAKRMSQTEKRINPETRLYPKTAGTDKYNTKAPEDLRESYAPKHDQWDNDVLDKELSDNKKGQSEQERRTKELQKKREEYLRAANKVDVKFSHASNAWVISEKATGIPIVIASVEDITGNHPISPEALAELKSDKFGELIMEDIKESGLETTARNLLGDTFDKLAAEHMSSIKTAEEKADLRVKLETLKDIYASLKEGLGKLTKVASVSRLFKRAVEAIQDAEEAVEIGKDNAPEAISDAAEALTPISDIGLAMEGQSEQPDVNKLAEEIKASISDPEIQAKVDQLVDMVLSSNSGTTPLIENEIGEAEEEIGKAEEEIGEAEEEEEEEEEIGETEEEIGKTEEKEEKGKKEKKEDKDKGKKTSAVVAALKKLGADRGKGDYDVTKGFSLDQMGEHNKGNITQDGKKFMTWETLKKQFEALVNKKPTGKLVANFVNELIKTAAGTGVMSAEEVYRLAFGPEYAKQLTKEMTQKQILKEHDRLTKDTDNVYASASEAYLSGATRMKLAIEATQNMVKKGLIKEADREAFDHQVDNFMKMDEDTFRAFMDSTENIVATSELEDGRFKVAALDKPDEYGNIVTGWIDGKHVASMNGEDIKAPNGKVTKAHLANAMHLLKQAFKEGLFDEELSDGKVPTDVQGVDLKGLNVGQESSKPVLKVEDLI